MRPRIASNIARIIQLAYCAGLFGLIGAGCADSVPPDPQLQIIGCDRPDTIDTSLIDAFEITFDGVDPRTDVPKVALGGSIHVVGTLTPKPGTTQSGDDLSPVVGYRRTSGGNADWSVPPCKMGGRNEWNLGTSQRGTPVRYIDNNERVDRTDFEPGDYELRFYVIRTNDATEATPIVYYISRGRMTVLPAAAETAQGE
jgi:hypothetical protein